MLHRLPNWSPLSLVSTYRLVTVTLPRIIQLAGFSPFLLLSAFITMESRLDSEQLLYELAESRVLICPSSFKMPSAVTVLSRLNSSSHSVTRPKKMHSLSSSTMIQVLPITKSS